MNFFKYIFINLFVSAIFSCETPNQPAKKLFLLNKFCYSSKQDFYKNCKIFFELIRTKINKICILQKIYINNNELIGEVTNKKFIISIFNEQEKNNLKNEIFMIGKIKTDQQPGKNFYYSFFSADFKYLVLFSKKNASDDKYFIRVFKLK